MKCIEDEIPFAVPEGWAWCRISTIAFVTKLAGFEYTKDIAPNLCKAGIPLFKGKNIQDGKIIYEFETYIPETVSDELPRSQINRKCILAPYVGTIGNIGIHNKMGKYHLGSNVGKIEIYNATSILMEEYVVSYLQSSYGYRQLTKRMKATAQASISIEAIRDVYIPLPPEKEQKRMWKSLSNTLSIVDRIANDENNIITLIKEIKSKILDLAIRGKLVSQDPNDEPASVLLERIRAEKEELIQQGKIKRDKKESVIFKGDDNSYYEKIGDAIENIDSIIPFEIPDDWEIIRFRDIWELVSGRDLSPSEYNDENIGIPYITGASNFNNGNIELVRWTPNPQVMTHYGDLLITCKGTIGEMAFNNFGDAHIARQIMAIRSAFNLNREFLSYCICFYINSIKESAKGIIPGISREDILKLILPIPSTDYQERVVAYIKKINSFLFSLEKNLN